MRRILHITTPLSGTVQWTPSPGTIWRVHYLSFRFENSAAAASGTPPMYFGVAGPQGMVEYWIELDVTKVANSFLTMDFAGNSSINGGAPVSSPSIPKRPVMIGEDMMIQGVGTDYGTVTTFDLVLQVIEEGV